MRVLVAVLCVCPLLTRAQLSVTAPSGTALTAMPAPEAVHFANCATFEFDTRPLNASLVAVPEEHDLCWRAMPAELVHGKTVLVGNMRVARTGVALGGGGLGPTSLGG